METYLRRASFELFRGLIQILLRTSFLAFLPDAEKRETDVDEKGGEVGLVGSWQADLAAKKSFLRRLAR